MYNQIKKILEGLETDDQDVLKAKEAVTQLCDKALKRNRENTAFSREKEKVRASDSSTKKEPSK